MGTKLNLQCAVHLPWLLLLTLLSGSEVLLLRVFRVRNPSYDQSTGSLRDLARH